MDDNLWDWVVSEGEKGLQEYRKQGELPAGQASSWTINTLAAARMIIAVEEFRKSSADLITRLVFVALLLFVIGLFLGALIFINLIGISIK